MSRLVLMAFLGLAFAVAAREESQAPPPSYEIAGIQYHETANRAGVSFSRTVRTNRGTAKRVGVPFLEARVVARLRRRFDRAVARAYFFEPGGNMLPVGPATAPREQGGPYALPAFFEAGQAETLYFPLPEPCRNASRWYAVIVFGDKTSAASAAYPPTHPPVGNFPEKTAALSPRSVLFPDDQPLLENRVRIDEPRQPQLTLFLLPPPSGEKPKGVLAACLLADGTEEIKKRMLVPRADDDLKELAALCRKNNWALLCWGARNLWNKSKNWNAYAEDEYRAYDRAFDKVSKAWSDGVRRLCERAGVSSRRLFLWGASGSAQYAMRLALRHPEHFHAVWIHIPSSFDKPVPEARRILWCLTTGELEGGYARSLEFFRQCRELNYPILYKAIPELGHRGNRQATRLGLAFFDFAAQLLPQTEASSGASEGETGMHSFVEPPFWGDALNQVVYPARDKRMIAPPYRVPLPTSVLAELWKQNP